MLSQEYDAISNGSSWGQVISRFFSSSTGSRLGIKQGGRRSISTTNSVTSGKKKNEERFPEGVNAKGGKFSPYTVEGLDFWFKSSSRRGGKAPPSRGPRSLFEVAEAVDWASVAATCLHHGAVKLEAGYFVGKECARCIEGIKRACNASPLYRAATV